jgi:hypothetical protein
MNLVELILKQLLSGDVLGNLAGALGASTEDTKKAVSASIPAMLGGIGSLASKPEGAKKLWNSLKQVDDNIGTDWGGMLTGEKGNELAKSGTSMLESVFGKGLLGALINGLGGFLGGKSALITKLLPMLAPMLMGTIARQVKSGGLDLAGLTKMLTGQKGNIAAAMPQGLLNSLSGVQGLSDLTGFAKGAAATAGSASRAAASAATEAVSPLKWLLPLLALVAISFAGYWFFMRPKPVVTPKGPRLGTVTPSAADQGAAATSGIGAAADLATCAAELTSEFTSLFDKFGKTLAGVTDAASAQAAVPELQKMNDQIDPLKESLEKLPAAVRPAVNKAIETSTKVFQEQSEKVLALPGVGDVLKSVIDGIVKKLVALVTD